MADLALALFARLRADPDVSALTEAIHWVVVPQDTPLPYVRLQVISDTRPMDLDDYLTARQTRVQVDCFAARHSVARAIALAIKDALKGPATVEGVTFGRTRADGPRDMGERAVAENTPGAFVHRARMDLWIEHDAA